MSERLGGDGRGRGRRGGRRIGGAKARDGKRSGLLVACGSGEEPDSFLSGIGGRVGQRTRALRGSDWTSGGEGEARGGGRVAEGDGVTGARGGEEGWVEVGDGEMGMGRSSSRSWRGRSSRESRSGKAGSFASEPGKKKDRSRPLACRRQKEKSWPAGEERDVQPLLSPQSSRVLRSDPSLPRRLGSKHKLLLIHRPPLHSHHHLLQLSDPRPLLLVGMERSLEDVVCLRRDVEDGREEVGVFEEGGKGRVSGDGFFPGVPAGDEVDEDDAESPDVVRGGSVGGDGVEDTAVGL
jgi:hypothetical protein